MRSCIALVSAVLAGVLTRLAMIVPRAQAAAADKMITTPEAETPTLPPPRPDSRPTPASPMTSPVTGASPSRAWFSTASMPSSHSGTVAMSSAASPDGTVCSATHTAPLAPSSRTPTMAQPSHSPRPGQYPAARPIWSPFASAAALASRIATGNMIRPAIRNRTDASTSGGIVSSPTLMAR